MSLSATVPHALCHVSVIFLSTSNLCSENEGHVIAERDSQVDSEKFHAEFVAITAFKTNPTGQVNAAKPASFIFRLSFNIIQQSSYSYIGLHGLL
jgi:hypothetical protein